MSELLFPDSTATAGRGARSSDEEILEEHEDSAEGEEELDDGHEGGLRSVERRNASSGLLLQREAVYRSQDVSSRSAVRTTESVTLTFNSGARIENV